MATDYIKTKWHKPYSHEELADVERDVSEQWDDIGPSPDHPLAETGTFHVTIEWIPDKD